MLKDYLSEKGVFFTEKLVDQDDVARDEMSHLSDGFLGVPFSVVETSDGHKDTIIGFDKGKLEQLLQPGQLDK
jgi:hypothetical protein